MRPTFRDPITFAAMNRPWVLGAEPGAENDGGKLAKGEVNSGAPPVGVMEHGSKAGGDGETARGEVGGEAWFDAAGDVHGETVPGEAPSTSTADGAIDVSANGSTPSTMPAPSLCRSGRALGTLS